MASVPTLEDVLKDIEKISGKGAILTGVEVVDIPRVPVPAQQLNLTFTGGGFPRGRMVEFFGVESAGKALPNYQGVLTSAGYVPIGLIQPGDMVAAEDGHFYEVTGVYPQGKKRVYELEFSFGIKVRCSEDHLWTISRDRKKTFVTESLSQILEKGIKGGFDGYKDRFWVELPDVKPLEYPEKDLPIDPYLLGCLIGDGSLAGNFGFSVAEDEIKDKVSEILARDWKMELRHSAYFDYRICYKGSTRDDAYTFENKEGLHAQLKNLDLLCCSSDKHIPKQYLFASIEQRQALLDGLFDTDGYVDEAGGKEYATTSAQLAKDIKFLAESLGFKTFYKQFVDNTYVYKGQICGCKDSYVIRLYGSRVVGTLTRKVSRQVFEQRSQRSNVLKLLSATYIDEEECTCISVNSPSHLFLTEHAIPTHNTTTSLIVAAGFQKADERPIFFVDAEGTYDPIWAQKLGVDNKRVIRWRPDSSTAEEIFEQVLHVVESDGVSLVIIDSFPALVPQNVEEKNMTQLTMAGISKPLSTFSQKMVKVLLRHPTVSLIGLNQVRDSMSQYGDPLSTPGGHAWKHFCSIRLLVKSTPVDDAGKELSDKSDAATGVRIWTFLKKNKTGPRDWKTVSFTVDFMKGFNPKLDLVETAVMLGLIEQRGSSYSFVNKDTGEILKAMGKRAFVEKLEGDNELQLREAVLSYSKLQTVPVDLEQPVED